MLFYARYTSRIRDDIAVRQRESRPSEPETKSNMQAVYVDYQYTVGIGSKISNGLKRSIIPL